MLPFEEARDLARRSPYYTSKEWKLWTKATGRPDGVPHDPSSAYADQWKG